jgi:hypothetical protein
MPDIFRTKSDKAASLEADLAKLFSMTEPVLPSHNERLDLDGVGAFFHQRPSDRSPPSRCGT